MNKKISFKFLIISLAATLTISFILPFNHISADTPTYVVLNRSNSTNHISWTRRENNYNMYRYVRKGNSADDSTEIRSVALYYTYDDNTISYCIYFAYNYDLYNFSSQNVVVGDPAGIDTYESQNNTVWTIVDSYLYNNVNYKLKRTNLHGTDKAYVIESNSTMPFINADDKKNYTQSELNEYVMDLMFGNNSEPSVEVSEFTFNYYTDFASNTQNTINSMKSNRDTIIWDYDFNNSNISALDLRVDIRAIPVNYYSATEQGLKELTWNSLNLNASLYADLGSYHINYNMRKVSFTWEEVVNRIKYISNLPDIYNNLVNDWNFKIFNLNNNYYWTGWVYQIRLNTESGDYVGEWQTIYQVSSAPPDSATTTINYYVNGTGMTEPVYQTIQNINNQNNVTNNTWYVNGSPYDIDPSTGQSWWEQLLQFITNIVSEILGFLGSIFDSVITGVLEFIHDLGIDFLGIFENLISNIVDLFGNIDLTGNDYTIPEEYTDDLNTYNTWTTGVFNIFFSSGLALFVLIPLILMIVRLVL